MKYSTPLIGQYLRIICLITHQYMGNAASRLRLRLRLNSAPRVMVCDETNDTQAHPIKVVD